MKEAVPPTNKVFELDPVEAETKVGGLSNVKLVLFPVVILSVNDKSDNVRLPLLFITIEYTIISFVSLIPFPLTSETVADFVIFILGSETVLIIVGSFVVFPSLSIPSSLTSFTSLKLSGLLAVTETVLIILPVSTAC